MAARALLALGLSAGAALAGEPITLRIDYHQRADKLLPTYLIYERDGKAICTTVRVCNGAAACTPYRHEAGAFLLPEDRDSKPYSSTRPKPIPPNRLVHHLCLVEHRLLD